MNYNETIFKSFESIVTWYELILVFPDSKVHGANGAGTTQVGPMLAPYEPCYLGYHCDD